MSDDGQRALYRNLGRYSRLAGLGFVVLTSALLALSVYYQYIVFEVDSVVAFLAAIILLFRDQRARVEVGVFEALQDSSDRAISDLASRLGTGFWYVPVGEGVGGVALLPVQTDSLTPGGAPSGSYMLSVTPPGRGLAELFRREAGLKKVTLDSISAALPEVVRENFGLARSVDVEKDGELVKVTLHHPSSTCSDPGPGTKGEGRVGCTVASFLAVLVCSATERPLLLEGCTHDPDVDTWTVRMQLLQGAQVSA